MREPLQSPSALPASGGEPSELPPPGNAVWFIDNTLIGDPIIITGSPRKLEPTNGWGHWQENWRQWLRWSSVKYFTTESL